MVLVGATEVPLTFSEFPLVWQQLFHIGVHIGGRAPVQLEGKALEAWSIAEFESVAKSAYTNRTSKP